MSDRSGSDHYLIETAHCICYGQIYSTGSCLTYQQQRFLRLARGLPYLSMATFPEVWFWELSYVNVPTVNSKYYSMNVAIRTRYVIPPHYLITPHCSYVLHVPAFRYD